MAEVIVGLRVLSAELDRLDDVAARLYGLNRTDMRALEIVARVGPVAPTELANRLGFTTGGTTTVVDRLERAGFVQRTSDPSDRRRLLVEVTPATRRQDETVFGGLVRAMRQVTTPFTDDELRVISSFLDRTREVTRQYVEELAAGAHDGESHTRRHAP
ncbi:MAG TPA: MarR family transcriptional regulator [Acidimicrobiales bacterium]|nr:MarR family transcriptional regulator [Acidimicrobiales bacterium]